MSAYGTLRPISMSAVTAAIEGLADMTASQSEGGSWPFRTLRRGCLLASGPPSFDLVAISQPEFGL